MTQEERNQVTPTVSDLEAKEITTATQRASEDANKKEEDFFMNPRTRETAESQKTIQANDILETEAPASPPEKVEVTALEPVVPQLPMPLTDPAIILDGGATEALGIDEITTRILNLKEQVVINEVLYFIKIGKLLIKAKAELKDKKGG